MSETFSHDRGAANAVELEQARTEIQEYLHVREQRRRLFPRAALVGLLAGLTATAFRALLAGGDMLRTEMLRLGHRAPLIGWVLPVLLGATGAALSVLMVRRAAPEASGSGIPHLEAVLHRMRELDWKRVLPVKFFGGGLALAAGLALGREGPTVQMGGAVGAAVSDWLRVGNRDRLTLITAGAGAGLAAAFNAPLAGLIFVLEEVRKDFRQGVFGAAFIAAAVSDIVARFASGQLPVFHVPGYPVMALGTLPAFAALGIVCGLLGIVYNRSLIGTLNLATSIPDGYRVPAAAVVGAVAGLIAWFAPSAVGGGHALAESFLEGHAALAVIPIWFCLRFILSMASYGTGAPGGIFAPLLVLGALIGLAVGKAGGLFLPHLFAIPGVFAVVGMAAYFTSIVRAPLTGIVLIVEMTGSYAQMLPLLVACFCAYAVAEAAGDLPIYENLLERDLLRGGKLPEQKEPYVLELEIEPGSAFDNRRVRDLGLPTGCILVSCMEDGRELVPMADTLLEAHMRVTALISPEAVNAANALRHGCEGPD